MKVLHIVPSAFSYFNDIREAAFAVIKDLEHAGVACEVFTLQYSAPSPAVKTETVAISGGRHFDKTVGISDLISSFQEFDIIHLHCPFLGAAGKILAWARTPGRKPLLITYYRQVRLVDLFSVFIAVYNGYYLNRIFNFAGALTCLAGASLPRKWQKNDRHNRWLRLLDKSSAAPLTAAADKVKLTVRECGEIAAKLLLIYQKITH